MRDLRAKLAKVLHLFISANLESRHPAMRSTLPDDLTRLRHEWEMDRLLAAGAPEAVLLDSRRGVALIVAYRALAIAADRRGVCSERLGDQAEAAFRRSVVRGGR